MSYKALYRKYRPNTFEEVYGQQHIVMTLKSAIENDRLAHAYLFCGPRGTGKTSIAKLLAKTINCSAENRPCGKCASCQDIQNSSHPDVMELDGATNNGVDEIRELVDGIKYAPMQGRYKVYIIDEVHMITANAFNALLKTLEEPPAYCVFILCTTDPHKVLPTIISRCQRFDFNKITTTVIKGRIKEICEKEDIKISDEAAQLIAELADGGLRDALSILDQCIAYSQSEVKEQDVVAVYGIATTREKLELFKTVRDKDADRLIELTTALSNRGSDLRRLTTDLINMAKEAVIYDYSGNKALLERMNEKEVNELLDNIGSADLLRNIDILMDAASKYAFSTDTVAYFEVAFLKMMQNNAAEKLLFGTEVQKDAPETVDKTIKKKQKDIKRRELSEEELLAILSKATKEQREKNQNCWKEVSESRDGEYLHIAKLLEGAAVMADSQDELIVVVEDKIVADNLNEQQQLSLLEQLVEKCYGSRRKVVTISLEHQKKLIEAFKKKRDKAAVEAEAINNRNMEVTQRLTKLLGKDGFEEVEE